MRPGAWVLLKSGGPPMRVVEVIGRQVRARWRTAGGFCEAVFPAACLILL